MAAASDAPSSTARPAWAAAVWLLLNFAALGLAWMADLLSARAIEGIRRTFRVPHDAGWIWLAGLVMAGVWVVLSRAQWQAAAHAPRWGFGVMFLVTGALVVMSQPTVFFHIQDLLARAHLYRPLRAPLRLILLRGFDDFFILTAQVLLLLNLLGLWETRNAAQG